MEADVFFIEGFCEDQGYVVQNMWKLLEWGKPNCAPVLYRDFLKGVLTMPFRCTFVVALTNEA